MADAVDRLSGLKLEPSFAQLRRVGLKKAARHRTIVVDFGTEEAIFEAVAPEGYVVDGKWRPLRDLDGRFK